MPVKLMQGRKNPCLFFCKKLEKKLKNKEKMVDRRERL